MWPTILLITLSPPFIFKFYVTSPHRGATATYYYNLLIYMLQKRTSMVNIISYYTILQLSVDIFELGNLTSTSSNLYSILIWKLWFNKKHVMYSLHDNAVKIDFVLSPFTEYMTYFSLQPTLDGNRYWKHQGGVLRRQGHNHAKGPGRNGICIIKMSILTFHILKIGRYNHESPLE